GTRIQNFFHHGWQQRFGSAKENRKHIECQNGKNNRRCQNEFKSFLDPLHGSFAGSQIFFGNRFGRNSQYHNHGNTHQSESSSYSGFDSKSSQNQTTRKRT